MVAHLSWSTLSIIGKFGKIEPQKLKVKFFQVLFTSLLWDFLLNGVYQRVSPLILLHEKFLQFDWLRAVVFQLNLKYLHVKITKLSQVVV